MPGQLSLSDAGKAAPGWLAGTEVPARDDLALAGVVQQFRQDQQIYGDGDDAVYFYKIVTGMVRTCKFLDDGRRQVEEFHGPGAMFGFEDGATHQFAAEAVRASSVIAYRRRSFDHSADARLRQQIFQAMMRQLVRARHHMVLLGCKTAVEKVAGFLVDLAGAKAEGKTINLAMTRQDIGDYLGLTIETVSRMISQLEREGLIELIGARKIRFVKFTELNNLSL